MKTRRNSWLYGLLGALAISVAAIAPRMPIESARADTAGDAPKSLVQNLTDKVIDILANDKLSVDEKKHQIENQVYANVDFQTLSRLVLARNWSKFTPDQQKQFIDEFKEHLSVTYGNNVQNYHNEKVQIQGDREEPGGDWTVQTKILRGGGANDIELDYRLRKKDGTWKIIDIIVDNVSLLANFRSQFQDIVSNGGPERLLQLLKEKNAKGESLKS